MYNSLTAFKRNIASIREIDALYSHLKDTLKVPVELDDLLRFQVIYAVSAFDKLVHDIVRIGMIETFTGNREATAKYLNESISMQSHTAMAGATIPPKEYFFEQEIIKKMKMIAYQDPDRVADGLSYIWNEPHKWQAIATKMEKREDIVRKQLKLIVDRRNNIVHEADIDLVTGNKNLILKSDSDEVVEFIESCGEAIVSLVV